MWLKRSARAAVTAISQISRGTSVIAVIFLLSMMVLTVLNVFLRYVFRNPVSGSCEITEFLVIGAGLLGVAWCAIKGGHLGVDILIKRLSIRQQSLTETITLLLSLTVVPIVAWQGFVKAIEAHDTNAVSLLLRIPSYPFIALIGIGYTLFTLVLLVQLAKHITKAFGK